MTKTMQATKMIYQDATYPIAERVQDLLARMTLEEKIAQLGSYWVYDLLDEQGLSAEKASALIGQGIGQISRVGGATTLAPVDIAKRANAIQSYLVDHTRLGIPAIVHEECCSGYLALGATSFPQMIGLASTWAPELAEQMTCVIRKQLRAVGAHQGLSPVLDLSRDPRWGRVEETFGEDPLLAAQMGMAYVRGLQGPDLRQGVMGTAKHFAGHGISEGGLNCAPVQLGQHELRDIFLMPFEAVIQEANVASVMNAYSELDGVVVAASRRIMTELLRRDLQFDGLVVSDYFSISMLANFHHVAKDLVTAAQLALQAGINVELPTTECYGAPLLEAVRSDSVLESTVDTAVKRILQKKFELGLFEDPYVDADRVASAYETPEQRQLARLIAVQSIVLLKNGGSILPLSKDLGTIAVIGPNANQARHLLGDYSHPAHIENLLAMNPKLAALVKWNPQSNGIIEGSVRVTSVLDAIRKQVSSGTRVLFAPGCSVNSTDRSGFPEAVQAAQSADAVILVVGDKAGLTLDCTCGEFRDRADLGLPGVQQELVEAIASLGKPTVVVLINGRPLTIPWIADNVAGLVEAWLPGEEGGAAVAEVLFGDANPGGKLPITFPRSVGQIPIFYNHKPSGARSFMHGDYVSLPTSPLFAFGHGLSYTRFEYTNLRVDPLRVEPGKEVVISVQIKNVGSMAGDEVVQLYVRDEVACLPRPVKELKGFRRIHLATGECRTVVFAMPVDQLGFYDETMQLVVEPGIIQVMVGGSSEDIRLNASFEILGQEKRLVPRRVFGSATQVL